MQKIKDLITTTMDEICFWKKTTTNKQPDWRHQRLLSQPSSSAISHLLKFESRIWQKAWFLGALRASVNESSWFINRIKWLWKHCGVMKCLKSTALFQSFLVHLQLRYCHLVLKRKYFFSFKNAHNPVDPKRAQHPVSVCSFFPKSRH